MYDKEHKNDGRGVIINSYRRTICNSSQCRHGPLPQQETAWHGPRRRRTSFLHSSHNHPSQDCGMSRCPNQHAAPLAAPLFFKWNRRRPVLGCDVGLSINGYQRSSPLSSSHQRLSTPRTVLTVLTDYEPVDSCLPSLPSAKA
jgi:hypothetical protein